MPLSAEQLERLKFEAQTHVQQLSAIWYAIKTGGGVAAGMDINEFAGILSLTKGGTGATDAVSARASLGAAKSGANTDIASLTPVGGVLTVGGLLQVAGYLLVNSGDGTVHALDSNAGGYASLEFRTAGVTRAAILWNAASGIMYFQSNGATQFTSTANGITPTAATYPKVLAYPAITQTLTVGSTDVVAFGTEVADNANAFASNAFTVPANAAGVYYVGIGNTALLGGTNSAWIYFAVYVNGIEALQLTQVRNLVTGGEYLVQGSSYLQLNAGDVVTIRARQVDGTTGWQIYASSSFCRLTIYRLF